MKDVTQLTIGPLVRKTPLNLWHHTHNGRMVDFAGWDMPVQYSSIVEEHSAIRNAVGLFDISHMGRLQFRGDLAAEFLNGILTNVRRNSGSAMFDIRWSVEKTAAYWTTFLFIAFPIDGNWLLMPQTAKSS